MEEGKKKKDVETTVGEASDISGENQVLLIEAIQDAVRNAPPPPEGTDIQSFRLLSVELEQGGFVNATRTRVTLEVRPGSLGGEPDRS